MSLSCSVLLDRERLSNLSHGAETRPLGFRVPGENEAERNAEVTRRCLEAVALATQQRKLVLQEVLSRPGAEAPFLAAT
jgi:hypothetical protein